MRKLAAALLAVPILAVVYAVALVHRPRAMLALGGAVAILAAGVVAFPRPMDALPPVVARPLAAADFGPNVSGRQALDGPVSIRFGQPMDAASVAAAISVKPAAPVALSWLDGGRHLVVSPRAAWSPTTYYTVTVGASARTTTGVALSAPVIAAFLTAGPTQARIAATAALPTGRIAADSSFVVTFDRPVQVSSARAALRIDPPVEGTFTAVDENGLADQVTFVPAQPLSGGTTYTVTLVGTVRDADGAIVADAPAFVAKTAVTPAVVRFRPVGGSTKIARDAAISVRFTQRMDPATTKGAFVITTGGAALKGTYSWAENGTVLVFVPRGLLPYGATIRAQVTAAARSADRTPIARPIAVTFTTVAKPVPVKAPVKVPAKAPATKPVTKPIPVPSGGGTAGGATWLAVERYYLSLMNCTRTGGLVTGSGACSNGGRNHTAPLVIDAGISDRVSRPYAKYLASVGVCSHFYGPSGAYQTPGQRLARAGYTSYKWAENLGCYPDSSLYDSALQTQLYFQSERSWSPPGGHYVNLMNPLYDRAGIGVWAVGRTVRIVIDFYHP